MRGAPPRLATSRGALSPPTPVRLPPLDAGPTSRTEGFEAQRSGVRLRGAKFSLVHSSLPVRTATETNVASLKTDLCAWTGRAVSGDPGRRCHGKHKVIDGNVGRLGGPLPRGVEPHRLQGLAYAVNALRLPNRVLPPWRTLSFQTPQARAAQLACTEAGSKSSFGQSACMARPSREKGLDESSCRSEVRRRAAGSPTPEVATW